MPAEHNLTITAQAVDEVSGPMRQAAEAMAAAAAGVANSDRQMVQSAREVEMAKRSQVSASKQVELAIRSEAAAGQPLEQQMIRLELETEKLAAQMRALVRAGQPVPQAMLAQAGAARDAAEKIREKVGASKQLEAQLGTMTTRMGPAALALGAIGAAAAGARQALNGVVDSLISSAPELVSLQGEISRTDAALIALKETASDEQFKGIAGTIAQVLTVAYAAVSTEALEARRQSELTNLSIVEREKRTQAMMQVAQDAVAASTQNTELALKNIERLREIESKQELTRKTNAERQKKRDHDFLKAIADTGAAMSKFDDDYIRAAAEREQADKRSLEAKNSWAQTQMELADKVTQYDVDRAAYREDIYGKLAMDQVRANHEHLAEVEAQYAAEAQATLAMHQMVHQAAAASLRSTIQVTTTELMSATTAWISGAKSAEDAYKEMGKNIVQTMVQQLAIMLPMIAAEAAARAFAAHVGVGPFIGVALGLSAAAVAAAYIMSLKKFNKGGMVTGGREGEDSVPALLTPGELVVPVPMVRSFKAMLAGGGAPAGGMQRFAAGGMVAAGAGGGNVTLHTHYHLQQSPSDADLERMHRRDKRWMAEAMKNRRFPRGE